MKTPGRIKVMTLLVAAGLAGCGHQPVAQSVPVGGSSLATRIAAATHTLPGQRTAFDSVDVYKNDVAEQIMRYNAAHTFSGQLPPMLPAIVVLAITVDRDGKMTKVVVQRSRDNDASKVALASMARSGQLPKPFNLIHGGSQSLTFSETFLFNRDYQFQLRTLAGVQ
jgi:protein TonB